jgi:hypothetical protein
MNKPMTSFLFQPDPPTSSFTRPSTTTSNTNNNNSSSSAKKNYDNLSLKRGVPIDHWRSVIDNFMIELLSALFINVSAVMYGGMKTSQDSPLFENPWTQFIPALVMGLVMVSLKDDDLFFPDTTHTMTLLMWAVGAYDTWLHPFARILGQTTAIGITLWFCKDIPTVQWVSLGRLPAVIFSSELLSTIIEHMSVVYLFLPLLPVAMHVQMHSARSKHSLRKSGVRVMPKNDPDTEEPRSESVAIAALLFSGVHWCLRLTFLSEISPSLSVIKATLWAWQHHAAAAASGTNSTVAHPSPSHGSSGEVVDEIWSECLMAVWGQMVGFLIALVYIVNYLPLRKAVRAAES